jgi:hypothetical protein
MTSLRITLALLAVSVSLHAADSPAGTWTAEVPSAWGRSLLHTFTIKVDGEKVEGTAKFGRGEGPLTDATLMGDTISFSIAYQAVNGVVKRLFRGTIHGETIDFAVTDANGTVNATARKSN